MPDDYVKIWSIVYSAQQAAFNYVREAFRAGRKITGAEVDDVARKIISQAGYANEFLHRTGHSIGEEGHGNGANID
ncbi:M24 family metallopeptidase, partial [Escherichia coli]|nr:M24 family metallopeptidase [Escherichia coli]